MNFPQRGETPIDPANAGLEGIQKVGYVAIIGKPNVGKSTLLNTLLDYKLSIVTPKPQTTRQRIIGILNGEDYQALFIDTPGVLDPKYSLQKFMQKEIQTALKDADLILYIVEPFNPPSDDEKEFVRRIKNNQKILVVINKVDLIEKRTLLPIIEEWNKIGLQEIYPISALYQNGVDELKEEIIENLPVGVPFYPKDQISERPEKFFVAEIIRGVIFNLYGEEVPYATTVEIQEFKEREKAKDYISAIIYVEKDSQKAIIIGKKGAQLKKVGTLARKEIENFLQRPVFLELWVKVKENWRRNPEFIKEKIYQS